MRSRSQVSGQSASVAASRARVPRLTSIEPRTSLKAGITERPESRESSPSRLTVNVLKGLVFKAIRARYGVGGGEPLLEVVVQIGARYHGSLAELLVGGQIAQGAHQSDAAEVVPAGGRGLLLALAAGRVQPFRESNAGPFGEPVRDLRREPISTLQVDMEDRAPQLEQPPPQCPILTAGHEPVEQFGDGLCVHPDGILPAQQAIEKGRAAGRTQAAERR